MTAAELDNKPLLEVRGLMMHFPVTDLTRSVRPCLGETRRLFALTRWVPGVYAWSALSSTFNERIGNGIDRD